MGKLKKSEIIAIEPKYFMKLSWYFGQQFVMLEKIIETIQYKIKGEKKNIIITRLENIIFSSILTKETKFPPVKKKVNDVRMRKKKSADDMYSLFFISHNSPSY